MKPTARNGFAHLYLVIIIVLVIGAGLWYFSSNSSSDTPNSPITSNIDKSDSKWLWNHCVSEIEKLPEIPLTYNQKFDVSENSPSTYITNDWAADLRENNKVTCQINYKYESEIAYPSVGVEYAFDIKNSNAFDEAVSSLYQESMPEGWELIGRLSADDAGRPKYVSDAFPLIYKRETQDTVEYLEIIDAISFHVELTVYEK